MEVILREVKTSDFEQIHDLCENDLGYKFTTSIGYIKLDKDVDIEKSISEADKMLYQNKEIAHNK